MAYDTGVNEKWLSVGKLKEILSVLPDDYELQVNAMGNILVCGPPDNNYYVGYIDFGLPEALIPDGE